MNELFSPLFLVLYSRSYITWFNKGKLTKGGENINYNLSDGLFSQTKREHGL